MGLNRKVRFRILARDDFKCVYCGRGKEDGVALYVDHRHPAADGGSDDDSNLFTACGDCNIGKSDAILAGKEPFGFELQNRLRTKTPQLRATYRQIDRPTDEERGDIIANVLAALLTDDPVVRARLLRP